jgi:hypothetical protein
MAGFELAYTLHGGDAHKLELAVASGQTFTAGALVELASGEATVAVTAHADILGVCTGLDAAGTTATVVVDPLAVYRIDDATARALGATLDIASGARGITTNSNADLVVVGKSPAGAPTLVKIATTQHAFTAN